MPTGVGAFKSAWCGLIAAAITFMEFNEIFNSKFGFNGKDKMELEGPDFCSGSDDGLGKD